MYTFLLFASLVHSSNCRIGSLAISWIGFRFLHALYFLVQQYIFDHDSWTREKDFEYVTVVLYVDLHNVFMLQTGCDVFQGITMGLYSMNQLWLVASQPFLPLAPWSSVMDIEPVYIDTSDNKLRIGGFVKVVSLIVSNA